VIDCGFIPRSALEQTDSGQIRLIKIREIIRASKYAIHDISRIEVTSTNPLPRFNMPFEFGLDLGCRFFGPKQLTYKQCLVLETQPYRYQAVLSDIAGQDIRAHNNSPDTAISIVRNWHRVASGRRTVPGPSHIKAHFRDFTAALPAVADRIGLDRHDLQFVEYVSLTEEWLKTVPAP
jgi:hypothetical protein